MWCNSNNSNSKCRCSSIINSSHNLNYKVESLITITWLVVASEIIQWAINSPSRINLSQINKWWQLTTLITSNSRNWQQAIHEWMRYCLNHRRWYMHRLHERNLNRQSDLPCLTGIMVLLQALPYLQTLTMTMNIWYSSNSNRLLNTRAWLQANSISMAGKSPLIR